MFRLLAFIMLHTFLLSWNSFLYTRFSPHGGSSLSLSLAQPRLADDTDPHGNPRPPRHDLTTSRASRMFCVVSTIFIARCPRFFHWMKRRAFHSRQLTASTQGGKRNKRVITPAANANRNTPARPSPDLFCSRPPHPPEQTPHPIYVPCVP